MSRCLEELQNERIVFSLCFVGASMLATSAFPRSFLSQYKGFPYHDSRYQSGPQKYQDEYCALTMSWAAKESISTSNSFTDEMKDVRSAVRLTGFFAGPKLRYESA